MAQGSDQSVIQVAREFGMRVNQIHKWRKEFDVQQGDAFPGKARQANHAVEVTRLKKGGLRGRANWLGQSRADFQHGQNLATGWIHLRRIRLASPVTAPANLERNIHFCWFFLLIITAQMFSFSCTTSSYPCWLTS